MTWMDSNMMNRSVLWRPQVVMASASASVSVFGTDPSSSSTSAGSSSGSSRRSGMSTRLSLVMTTFGFVVSAIFIMFVLIRLLCARFQSWRFASEWTRGVDRATMNLGGERHSNGLNPVVITMFPTIKFTKEMFASQEDSMCAICLEEYDDHDVLRILPACGHTFHVSCIDSWLLRHTTCPVCRIHLQSSSSRRSMPSPLLSEAARMRFCPGAIPESLFAHPLRGRISETPIQQCVTMVGHVHVVEILDVKEVRAHTSISSVQ